MLCRLKSKKNKIKQNKNKTKIRNGNDITENFGVRVLSIYSFDFNTRLANKVNYCEMEEIVLSYVFITRINLRRNKNDVFPSLEIQERIYYHYLFIEFQQLFVD